MAASSSASVVSTVRETVDVNIRDKITKSAIRREDNRLHSLAYEHLDLRIHPPLGSLLLTKGSPYSRVDISRLKGMLPYMLVEQRPPNQAVLCELGYTRGFFRCFVDCTSDAERDPWNHKRMFYRVPITSIKTTADVNIEDTRAFNAYFKHLSISRSSLAARAPFDSPTLAMKTIENCTVLDGVANLHRFTPPPETKVAVNIEDELFDEAINSLPPEQRHELHLRHCCPWAGVYVAGGGQCKCPGYSKEDPRTRLPTLLPQIAFGIKGCAERAREIRKRITDPEFIKQHQEKHARAAWERSMERLMGLETRACLATALIRLLAAYEMCGSVYGAAVVTTRFTRFFVLGHNRIAVEILPSPRTNYGGVPRSLPWSAKDQAEAQRAYIETVPNARKFPPPSLRKFPPVTLRKFPPSTLPNRRIVSEAQAPVVRPSVQPPRPPRRSLPGPKTPPTTPPRTSPPPSPEANDSAIDVRYRLPEISNIPPAHILRTPPRKVSAKIPFLNLKKPKPKSFLGHISPSHYAPAHVQPTRKFSSASTVNKPLPPSPHGPSPVCRLPPDYRPSVSYYDMFTEDFFHRLPWSFAVWAGPESRRGEPRTTRCNLDYDAIHAFSNLFTAAMIRIGQMPADHPMDPLPITSQFPRGQAIVALSESSGLPIELAAHIVDLALALEEPAHVHKMRDTLWTQDRPKSPAAGFHASTKPPRTPPTHTPDLRAMERALAETVRFVPVSRGEMEALIGRQVRADRRRYFTTYPANRWPEYWIEQQQRL